MKKLLFIFFVLGALFLSGCVSGERLARNTPFASGNNSFYRDGVNLFPLYYKEGKRQSILFPLIDIDDRGFAVRPFYHKDKDEHGILWPLAAFNKTEGWAGPVVWGQDTYGFFPLFINGKYTLWVFPFSFYDDKKNYGMLPLFFRLNDFWWVFPASWYFGDSYGVFPLFIKERNWFWMFPATWYKNEEDYGALPFFMRKENFFWAGNVLKFKDEFLVLPIFGKGKNWWYCLNALYVSELDSRWYGFLPLGLYMNANDMNALFTPLVSFSRMDGKLRWFNFALWLYHYSRGQHKILYPLGCLDVSEVSARCWFWPLFNYGNGKHNDAPGFLFDYESMPDGSLFHLKLLYPFLFEYKYIKNLSYHKTEILPWGALWYSDITARAAECRLLGGALWSSKVDENAYDSRVLWGAAFLNSKDADSRRFSLLYKLFSYHKFKDDVKWEFFPFVKIMKTAGGDSWSFAWRLLEKHDGGGHIFFIPWGKREDEK